MVTVFAQSDLLDVREDHEDTLLVSYSNESDYANIFYDAGVPVFHVRVRAKFYEERYPEDNESEEDGEGSIDKLSSTIKTQKLFEVDIAPPYFHKILKFALQHNSVFLQNHSWLKEDEYEIEKINDRYPFFKGQTFLTLQNENIINL